MAAEGAAVVDVAQRPRELQDPLNFYFYHPLAARVARALLPGRISPNAVSVTGAGTFVASVLFYLYWPGVVGLALGLTLMLLWHVLDGADGDLARLRGTASLTGELIDGVCDYFGYTFMYFAFAFRLDDTLGGWAWALAWSAGGSHILQTNHAETQRRLYAWRVYGKSWIRQAAESGDAVFGRKSWFSRWFGFWGQGYVWLSNLMSPSANPLDEALAAATPEEAARIRGLIRDRSRASLAMEMMLGANPKTLIIAASIALGGPYYYFVAVLTVLNLILIVSIIHHKRVERQLIATLGAR